MSEDKLTNQFIDNLDIVQFIDNLDTTAQFQKCPKPENNDRIESKQQKIPIENQQNADQDQNENNQ